MPREGTQTLVLVKPDGVDRGLVGQVLARFEQEGLQIAALDMRQSSRQLVEQHYEEHREKDFYEGLVTYLCDDLVVAAVLAGENAVETARNVVGHTDPAEAADGTIRGDLGQDSMEAAEREGRALQNVVHASADEDAAHRETLLWFGFRTSQHRRTLIQVSSQIRPECKNCGAALDDTASVIDIFQNRSEQEIYQIIDCGRCEYIWEVVITYGEPATAGIAVELAPAEDEMEL